MPFKEEGEMNLACYFIKIVVSKFRRFWKFDDPRWRYSKVSSVHLRRKDDFEVQIGGVVDQSTDQPVDINSHPYRGI